MAFSNTPRPEVLKSLADAKPVPFWLEDKSRPQATSALIESTKADYF